MSIHEGESMSFVELLNQAGLDGPEILRGLEDSVAHGFIDWGIYRDHILRMISGPEPEDLHLMITRSDLILQPLEDWLKMERYLNSIRRDSVSKLDFHQREYRCSQLENFILLLKLY